MALRWGINTPPSASCRKPASTAEIASRMVNTRSTSLRVSKSNMAPPVLLSVGLRCCAFPDGTEPNSESRAPPDRRENDLLTGATTRTDSSNDPGRDLRHLPRTVALEETETEVGEG